MRVLGDQYEYFIRVQGCRSIDGSITLEKGYTQLHGTDAAMDQVALEALKQQASGFPVIQKNAAVDSGSYHVGRDMATRWKGIRADHKLGKGRELAAE
jgi:hypothetical protein